MKFESSITVTNSNGKEIVLHLEPWGEQLVMPPSSTLIITAKAVQLGSFERASRQRSNRLGLAKRK